MKRFHETNIRFEGYHENCPRMSDKDDINPKYFMTALLLDNDPRVCTFVCPKCQARITISMLVSGFGDNRG